MSATKAWLPDLIIHRHGCPDADPTRDQAIEEFRAAKGALGDAHARVHIAMDTDELTTATAGVRAALRRLSCAAEVWLELERIAS